MTMFVSLLSRGIKHILGNLIHSGTKYATRAVFCPGELAGSPFETEGCFTQPQKARLLVSVEKRAELVRILLLDPMIHSRKCKGLLDESSAQARC